ncbi:sce7726 family protein [Hyalangium rubrum]|uniref:Sce7726 family protein n=1 Tax=Hyalangium rubrum TaxID=3103134 RepID=A0ABU5H8U5_9BACT|nr:sce7726 family protein [Hyalangium sp. s54d21]MDY7229907.1 sce7726 family protein [Hyalangium sp. s54d21]
MRDRDVRQALTESLQAVHDGDPDTHIRQEMGLEHGQVFVDVVVINGELHGYELKSESDTLDRLPHQVQAYSSVLDKATLVVGASHLQDALTIIPPWWGVEKAVAQPDGSVLLKRHRKARANPQQQPLAVAKLLWRDEVLEVLEALGVATGLRSKPRKVLYERLVGVLPPDSLRAEVRRRLKSRVGW